jgi:hypothetical protein
MPLPRPVLIAIVVAACNSEPVGRICDLGGEPAPGQTVVASPSLDCTSRTCLRVPQDNPSPPEGSRYPTGSSGLCTAECSSDADCEREPGSPCVSGFTCAVAVTVGPFCCRKFCTCKDYRVGDPVEEAACDPANLENDCPNIER